MKTEKLFKSPLNKTQQENSELNHLECQNGSTTLKSYPRRLIIELTNRCNYRCIMCGRDAVDFKTYELQMPLIKKLESCYPYIEEVTLHGWGEATLHSQFSKILEFFSEYPYLRKYFVTNGSTLDKIRREIFTCHVDLVAVSLDGVTPYTNDSIRKGANLERIISSLKTLVKEKKARKLDYPYINFVFTAMKSNIHELPEMINLAYEIGIPEVKVVSLTVFNDNLMPESLVDKQNIVRQNFNEARKRADKFDINLKLPTIQGEDKNGDLRHKPCALPWRDLYIGSDGFIRPCQSSAMRLGNVSDYDDFEQLWNSKNIKDLRRSVNNEEFMHKNCYFCYHSSCANWNHRHSFIQRGRDFAPDWKCETVYPDNSGSINISPIGRLAPKAQAEACGYNLTGNLP